MTLARTTARRDFFNAYSINTFDYYVRNILQPVMYLPLNETSGSIATNVMYSGGVGGNICPAFAFNGSGKVAAPWTEASPDPGVEESNEVADGEAFADVPTIGGGKLNIYNNGGVPGGHTTYTGILTVGDTYHAYGNVNNIVQSGVVCSHGNAAGWGSNVVFSSVGRNDAGPHIATQTTFGVKEADNNVDTTLDSLECYLIGQLDGGYVGGDLGGDTLFGLPAWVGDGINDYVQLEYNRLESVFDPDEGTMVCAVKLTAAQWQDANAYYAWTIGVDGNNRISLFKAAAGDILSLAQVFGGTAATRNISVSAGDYDQWLLAIVRWSTSADQLQIDIKNVNTSIAVSAGTWTASALTNTHTRLGALASSSYWPNAIGQPQLYNRALTDDEVATLYNLFRSQEPNAA